MHTPFPALMLGLLVAVGAGCASVRPSASTGPWDLKRLSEVPAVEWGARTGRVQRVMYEGEPLGGKPTRVFAYLGRPAEAADAMGPRFPAMVLVHGGGGTAFREWAEHWASRGYVALAMDLAGKGPEGPLPDGGPDQADTVKFRDYDEAQVRELWSYHAVAAVIRGHSLLRSLPEVDASRIGITGISWGGYLTCIVAGIDSRLKVAVPVYGCGFLGDNSVWKDGSLARMSPAARERWLRDFDPSRYLAGVRCPILFLNGTSDFAYPLDSYQKSYRLVADRHRNVSVVVDLPHGHLWTFAEVDAFVDSALTGGTPLPRVRSDGVKEGHLRATVRSKVPVREAWLCFTTDTGAWQKRKWTRQPARVEGRTVSAPLPTDAASVTAYLAVVDERGRRVSGEHVAVRR